MGFRANTYAKVWGVEPKSETNTKVKLSITKKNKETGAFDTEFSGFVLFVGSLNAKKAAALKEGDRIRLMDVDVTNTYNAEKKTTFTNFKCFSFEDGSFSDAQKVDHADPQPEVGNGNIDDSRLPF